MRFLVPFALFAAAALPGPHAGAADWTWPLPAPHHVVRGFDPPPRPWLPGHRGVDLAGAAGEPVLAAGTGTIAFAGVVARVPVVSVRHPGGLLTTYEPVRSRLRAGEPVSAGQRLGRLDPAGSHCAPAVCLHWGLRRGTDYLDPLALLHLNQVRLLPLGGPGGRDLPLMTGSAVAGAIGLALSIRRRRTAAAGAEHEGVEAPGDPRPPPQDRSP